MESREDSVKSGRVMVSGDGGKRKNVWELQVGGVAWEGQVFD
jgi:hypothetical protein